MPAAVEQRLLSGPLLNDNAGARLLGGRLGGGAAWGEAGGLWSLGGPGSTSCQTRLGQVTPEHCGRFLHMLGFLHFSQTFCFFLITDSFSDQAEKNKPASSKDFLLLCSSFC